MITILLVNICTNSPTTIMALMKRRCTCEVYGCNSASDPDPSSQTVAPGRLLAPSTVYQHCCDDKIWRAAKQCERMELDLLAATASQETHSEDVVSSRAHQSELGNEPAFVPNAPLEATGKGMFIFFGSHYHLIY